MADPVSSPDLARVIDPIEADITRLAEEAEGRRRELPQRCDLECYWQGRRDALVALLQAGSPFLAAVQHLRAENEKQDTLLKEWGDNYQRWTVDNFRLAPHAEVLQREKEAIEADLTSLRSAVRAVEQETIAKVNRFHQYLVVCAKKQAADSYKLYDTHDLIAAQERAVRQCGEYLNGDAYLAALVDITLKKDEADRLAASVQEPK